MPGVFMLAIGTTCAGKLAGPVAAVAVTVLPGAAVCTSVAPEAEEGGGLGARWWGAIWSEGAVCDWGRPQSLCRAAGSEKVLPSVVALSWGIAVARTCCSCLRSRTAATCETNTTLQSPLLFTLSKCCLAWPDRRTMLSMHLMNLVHVRSVPSLFTTCKQTNRTSRQFRYARSLRR